jgi:biotin synthase
METTVWQALGEGRDITQAEMQSLLSLEGEALDSLFALARRKRLQSSGNKVYFRGLVELSNTCAKNCYYCGVRAGNTAVHRYFVTDEEVLEAARYAHRERFASMVLQAGERSDKDFTGRISRLLRLIHRETNASLHITLSLGEQSEETYREWYELGAHRYLLRIEASDPDLYQRLHPADGKHDYANRIHCLHSLKKLGYQTGTGVMIGLPFQTTEHLASDLLFFKKMDIDMVGMGPYIEHQHTPLFAHRHLLWTEEERFLMSMKMVALLRIMMPDINIAATTAMQTLQQGGREFALKVGANVVMPNLTPTRYRDQYLLYKDKPGLEQDAEDSTRHLEAMIQTAGMEVGYGEWGDSAHYRKKKDNAEKER